MVSFSDDVKITTDAQEMENLYQELEMKCFIWMLSR